MPLNLWKSYIGVACSTHLIFQQFGWWCWCGELLSIHFEQWFPNCVAGPLCAIVITLICNIEDSEMGLEDIQNVLFIAFLYVESRGWRRTSSTLQVSSLMSFCMAELATCMPSSLCSVRWAAPIPSHSCSKHTLAGEGVYCIISLSSSLYVPTVRTWCHKFQAFGCLMIGIWCIVNLL